MKCENCGQDLNKDTIHIPITEENDMGDYKIKTCYSVKAVLKDE